MFRGIHMVRVDKVGRIKLPAEFRSVVEGNLDTSYFITSQDGRTIEIYSMREWAKLATQLMEHSTLDPDRNKLFEVYVYYGEKAEMDAQGRLLLPSRLRESAKIKDNVVIFGNLTYLSVADRDQYERILAKNTLSPSDRVQLEEVLTKTLSGHNQEISPE